MTERTDIRLLSSEELSNAVAELGEKPFRSRQLEDWIWTRGAGSFDEMTDLSKSFRGVLSDRFDLSRIRLSEQQVSRDGTIKCAFDVGVKKVVEGVLIPTTKRMTACISSQVGCSLACKFCATGKLKLLKNLTAGEIYDQVEVIRNLAEEHYSKPLSNIVYMVFSWLLL